jgi:hypothetical protein
MAEGSPVKCQAGMGGESGIALPILDAGARERVGGQCHALAALPRGKETQYLLYR